MANLAYTKLKLKVNKEVNIVPISNGTESFDLEVKKYLSIGKKIEMVTNAVNESIVSGIVRQDLLDVYLHLHIVREYTNLTFTEKAIENSITLFDELESNGVVSLVTDTMEPSEYEFLHTYLGDYAKKLGDSIKASVTGYSGSNADRTEILQMLNSNPDLVEMVQDIANSLEE